MKNIINVIIGVISILAISCEPQTDKIGEVGPAPSEGKIITDNSDQYNPIFKAEAKNGYIYHWDLGNNQTAEGQVVTSYFPFSGDYLVKCSIAGAGGKTTEAQTTFHVEKTDPNVANQPVWKELTGAGEGKTWVYNTVVTGTDHYPDYCYQTYNDTTYDYGGGKRCWLPENSWGQCVGITPDINGSMVFDLKGGLNYTYHHIDGDEGVKGTFILDTENMTLTVVDPYILDYNIECTYPEITATGVYNIVYLTDDEMILWQQMDPLTVFGTGWAWSFKRKGYNPNE